MTTLVIDRETLPESISSLFYAPRIVIQQKQDGGEATFTPAIDPADYDNDTDYFNAIPGMAERLIKSHNAPASEFRSAPRDWA
jgi:hypothetical protein